MQPARDAALVFQQRLAEQGITVQGFVSQGTVAGASHPLASVRSASLNEIMAFAMRHSDNSLAEEFGRLLALQVGADNSPAGAVQAVKSVLERKGITTTGLDMRNCSGLTEDSKLTKCNCAIWLRDRGRPLPKECPSWASSAPLRAV